MDHKRIRAFVADLNRVCRKHKVYLCNNGGMFGIAFRELAAHLRATHEFFEDGDYCLSSKVTTKIAKTKK